jgi:hypothetical protein
VNEKIWGIIEALEPRHDIIEIHFVDAAKIENVTSLSNKVIATYKKLIGLYRCVQVDATYGVAHLLIEDLTEGTIDRPTLYSVPVPIIMKIEIINRKMIKTASAVGVSMLTGGIVKIRQQEDGIGEEVNSLG